MFDEIMGLPAHPLIVHFAVVLTPVLALLTVVYAVLPKVRPQLAWAVALLALASPAAIFAAKQSGESLNQARFATAEGDLAKAIADHSSFANPLLLSTLGLGAAALLLVFATTPARAATGERKSGDRFGRPVTVVLSVLAVALAAGAGFYVFQAGDSGARAVWGA